MPLVASQGVMCKRKLWENLSGRRKANDESDFADVQKNEISGVCWAKHVNIKLDKWRVKKEKEKAEKNRYLEDVCV